MEPDAVPFFLACNTNTKGFQLLAVVKNSHKKHNNQVNKNLTNTNFNIGYDTSTCKCSTFAEYFLVFIRTHKV